MEAGKVVANIQGKPIRTLKDLMGATIKKGATLLNGGYDLFGEEVKKYVICKNGDLMKWEDWYKKPYPRINATEDADFEVIEPKQLPETKNQ